MMAALTALALVGCQKIDLSEDKKNHTEENLRITIYGTGKGSMEYPLTVDDVLNDTAAYGSEYVWVMGYVVGSTYRTLNNASFDKNEAYSSNILLSADSLCTNVHDCIPVELSSSKWQESFSIVSAPQGFRQCVLIQGKRATYFNKKGLRKICAGHWLFGFDISSVLSEPQEWTTTVI